jgi:hypothetical protein
VRAHAECACVYRVLLIASDCIPLFLLSPASFSLPDVIFALLYRPCEYLLYQTITSSDTRGLILPLTGPDTFAGLEFAITRFLPQRALYVPLRHHHVR